MHISFRCLSASTCDFEGPDGMEQCTRGAGTETCIAWPSSDPLPHRSAETAFVLFWVGFRG
eukprot:2501938-Rhodomonas_salina.1